MKVMDELVDLELKKNNYEQQLENSLVEKENMSELLNKLKRVEISEYKLVDNLNKLECVEAKNSKIYLNFSDFLGDPPNIDRIRKIIPQTDTRNNSGQDDKKPKKKPHITAYKQYTRDDILAVLEEVKKVKSALQVSKQINIPARTLYYRAKKMGIALTRNMRTKSLAKPFNAAYF